MKRLRAWRPSKTGNTRLPRSGPEPASSNASLHSTEQPGSPATPSSPCGASASTSLPSVAAGVCTSPTNTSVTIVEPVTTFNASASTVRDDDLDASFRIDFHSQCAQHAEKFSALLQELGRGHQQRDGQFREMYLATGQAFDAVQRGRHQEWLKLQEALERSALELRGSLLARTRDQKEEHDRQATRSLQACEAFADRMLERKEEARHQVEELVRSLFVSFTDERSGRPRPEIYHRNLPSFQMQHALGLQLEDVTPPFPEPPPKPERAPSLAIVTQAITPAPTYENTPFVELEASISVKSEVLEGSDSSTRTQLDDLDGEELIDAFDEHFSQSEDLRRQQWQRLQEFYDACFSKWQERFQEFQDSLTSSFILCTQDGTIGRILDAEETVRISVRAWFCDAEASRIDELKRSWLRQRRSIVSCYEDFIRSIKMTEETHFDFEVYRRVGRGLRKTGLRKTGFFGSILSPELRESRHADGEMGLPFSLMLILRRPGTSEPLLTAPSRTQARSAFKESQHRRDRAFDAGISMLRAQSRVLEAKRVDLFSEALFYWKSRATAAERERTAEFECRMDATKTEWNAYHAQSSRTADDLIAELGKEFSNAQGVREELYNRAVREAHALFMRTIREFPQAYRALLARLRDEEEWDGSSTNHEFQLTEV